MKNYNIPVFVVHHGCENMCSFCNQEKITGKTPIINFKNIKNNIDQILKTLEKNSNIEIAFFGGSFTAIPLSLREKYLKLANEYIKMGLVNGIRISTRPDFINKKILNHLKKYNVTTIELGAQSFDEKVLIANLRGHSKKDIINSSMLIKECGFKLGLQIMPGLYNTTYSSDLNSLYECLKQKPDFVRIYPTLVIKNTKLANLYNEKLYIPLTLEEALKISKQAVKIFENENIKIIKLGLHPSVELQSDDNIISGPFHPAFREIVESEIYFDFLEKFNIKNKTTTIYVSKNIISKVVGMKKINKLKLKNIQFKVLNNLESKVYVESICYTREKILSSLDITVNYRYSFEI